ncbi:MAG TPA: hypothetical protein DEQ86_06185 [Candidatus Jacksonbacteria bacterium]|nr:MAG: hypothetical protein A2240_00860 [Candidatus Jacksonbacteria bacterium RIFOXYA2_FULL_43_12]HCE49741.1 hypothetical protein [Candidatus Jacksonbacteria bacterium]
MIVKKNFNSDLGKKIRTLRKGKGLTLEQFNEIANLDLSKASLSAIENGQQQISALQLHLIAQALKTSADVLLQEAIKTGVNKTKLNKLKKLLSDEEILHLKKI